MSTLLQETFITETCCNCGIPFAITRGLYDLLQREKRSRTFYCPNGHAQHYTGESDKAKAERLARELAAARDREATLRDEKHREWKLRRQGEGRLRAFKKRVAGGVCPCCQRTFENLARHMKTKHPTFAKEEEPAGA